MRADDVLRELNTLDEDWIIEAKPGKQPRRRAVWAVSAAALLAFTAGAFLLLPRLRNAAAIDAEPPALEHPTSLPTAAAPDAAQYGVVESEQPAETAAQMPPAETVPTPTGIDPAQLEIIRLPAYPLGSYGFEGYFAYEISQLQNGNPWKAASSPIYLPVYRNDSYDPTGMPTGLDRDAMLEKLNSLIAAGAIGPVGEVEEHWFEDQQGAHLVGLKAAGDRFTVEVQADGTVQIEFNEPLSLPEEFVFQYEGGSVREASAALDYLMKTYAARFGLVDPRPALSTDYNVFGALNCRYAVYDWGGSPMKAMQNFALRQLCFYPDEAGKLWMIRLYDGLAAAAELGDYPLVNPTQAEQLLRDGHYQTSVPYPLAGDEPVASVELVYRSGRTEQTYLPYYRFLIDVTDRSAPLDSQTELHTFGAYYVPAVQPDFLDGLPTYEGQFN